MTLETLRAAAGKLLTRERALKLALVLGVCGVALIYLAGLGSKSSQQAAPAPEPAFSGEDYARQLEQRLGEMVSAITGESSPAVLVTLDSGEEQVYGLDAGGEDSTHVILKAADGSQQALAVTRLEPRIRGVIVVSSAAGDPRVRESLIQAVSTALHLSSARVYVTAGQGQTN